MDKQDIATGFGTMQLDAPDGGQLTDATSQSSQKDAQQVQYQQFQTIPSEQSQPQYDKAPPTPDMGSPQDDPITQPFANPTTPASAVDAARFTSPQQSSLENSQVQFHPPPIRPLLETEPNTDALAQDNKQNQGQQDASSLLPQKSAITKVTLSDELNVFYWTKTKEIISQIAEKAKSSVDSVITTLDPGMKEYLYSGGNVNIIVISETECLVSPIRDSFQCAFGRATVNLAPYNPTKTMTDHPIRLACGFQEAVTVAQEKIKRLRQDTSSVPQNQVVVVVQPTLVAVRNMDESTTPNNSSSDSLSWFSTYCILIEDPVLGITMKCFSQFIPIDPEVVESAKQARYPDDFHDRHLGYTASLDELMSYRLKFDPICGFGDEYGCFWLREWAGIYETQLIQQLSLTLANSYRRKWDDCARIDTMS